MCGTFFPTLETFTPRPHCVYMYSDSTLTRPTVSASNFVRNGLHHERRTYQEEAIVLVSVVPAALFAALLQRGSFALVGAVRHGHGRFLLWYLARTLIFNEFEIRKHNADAHEGKTGRCTLVARR